MTREDEDGRQGVSRYWFVVDITSGLFEKGHSKEREERGVVLRRCLDAGSLVDGRWWGFTTMT